MDFTIYSLATGVILRSGSGGVQQLGDGEGALYDVALADDRWRIDVVTGDPYEFIAPKSVEQSVAEINAERTRRIIAGKTISGIAVTGRDEDARNLTNLALGAQMRLLSGDTTTMTVFRDGANIDHELTPLAVIGLWRASADYVSALYAASWALKAMDPIPDNVAADAYWPAL